MTQADWKQLERVIAQMTDEERHQLMRRVEGSLSSTADSSGPRAGEDETAVAAKQKRAWETLWSEIDSLPAEGDTDEDGLVVSKDYRKVLYDGSSHTGFPEKSRT